MKLVINFWLEYKWVSLKLMGIVKIGELEKLYVLRKQEITYDIKENDCTVFECLNNSSGAVFID